MKKIVTFVIALFLALPLAAQESSSVLSPLQSAELALTEGRYSDVEQWYSGLSKNEKRTSSNLALATIAAINSYKMELAEERMGLYDNLRLRKEHEKETREQVRLHLEKVKRLLSNTRTVSTSAIHNGTLSELLEFIHNNTSHLGTTSATTFITPDGKTKWQVGIDSDSLPAFEVVHKLGNGQWDDTNSEIISIRGLPEKAHLSYPFLLSDGNTLYFSIEQEGITPPNTMGGKDIYVSRYDRDAQALLVPTQLSLPFNSASDDFAYIVDEQADFGWLITSRGSVGDTLQLYIFNPSTLTRYEGTEDISEIAMWHHPQLSERSYRVSNSSVAQKDSEPVLFWVGHQAIRSEDDLSNSQAKSALKRFLEVHQSVTKTEETLRELRQKLHDHPELLNNLQIREQVLRHEKYLEDNLSKLFAIRNEVIGLEFPTHR